MFRFNKNHIKMDMKKIRKVMSIFLACCLLLSINFGEHPKVCVNLQTDVR